MLKPVDKQTGQKRGTSEQEKARQRKEKEKADFYNRNPHRKWGDR